MKKLRIFLCGCLRLVSVFCLCTGEIPAQAQHTVFYAGADVG